MQIPWRTIPKRGITKIKGLKAVRVQFIQGTLNSPVWLEKPESRKANRREGHRGIEVPSHIRISVLFQLRLKTNKQITAVTTTKHWNNEQKRDMMI